MIYYPNNQTNCVRLWPYLLTHLQFEFYHLEISHFIIV